jgi:hypothetical protein
MKAIKYAATLERKDEWVCRKPDMMDNLDEWAYGGQRRIIDRDDFGVVSEVIFTVSKFRAMEVNPSENRIIELRSLRKMLTRHKSN